MTKKIFLILVVLVLGITGDVFARRVRDIQQTVIYPQEPIFTQVSAHRISPGFSEEQGGLKGVVDALEAYLREQGFGFALDYFDPETTFISLSKEAANNNDIERPDLLAQAQPGRWTIISQQLAYHGRDLQFEFATRDKETGELKIITMVIKGTGKGEPSFARDGFCSKPYYQRPFYIRSFDAVLNAFSDYPNYSVRQVIEAAYARNPEKNRFNSYTFIGGLNYEYACAEYLRALAIHRLLLELDGKPAGIPIYTGMNIIGKIPIIRNGEEILVDTEDYLTNPDILNLPELLTVAYELRELVRGNVRDERTIEQYLDLLWSENYATAIVNNPQLMAKVRSLVKREIPLATLTKWEQSNFRLKDWDIGDYKSALKYLCLLYGEDMHTYDSVVSVAKQFTYSLARTLGAIHGAGGSLTDGSEFISSVVPKDISLSGQMQDLADSAYIPFFGADPKVSGIRLDKTQRVDIGHVLESIGIFCNRLTNSINRSGIDIEYRDPYILCEEYFDEVYKEYHKLALDYMQSQGTP